MDHQEYSELNERKKRALTKEQKLKFSLATIHVRDNVIKSSNFEVFEIILAMPQQQGNLPSLFCGMHLVLLYCKSD